MKLKPIQLTRYMTVVLSLLSIIFSIGLTPHIEEITHSFVHQQGIHHSHSHTDAMRMKVIYSQDQHSQTENHSHQFSFDSDHPLAIAKTFSISSSFFSPVIEEKISRLLQNTSYDFSYLSEALPQGPPGLEFFISYPNKAPPLA